MYCLSSSLADVGLVVIESLGWTFPELHRERCSLRLQLPKTMPSSCVEPELCRGPPSCDRRAECVAGRVLGPFNPHDFPFGVVPKGRFGNWRLIVDLSSPHGDSVNEGIPESWCSLSYVSVQDTAQTIRRFGRGSLMARAHTRMCQSTRTIGGCWV